MQLGGSEISAAFILFGSPVKQCFIITLTYGVNYLISIFIFFRGTVGVVGFNDVERVWEPGERSNKRRHGHGAGLYIIPADLVVNPGTIWQIGGGNNALYFYWFYFLTKALIRYCGNKIIKLAPSPSLPEASINPP